MGGMPKLHPQTLEVLEAQIKPSAEMESTKGERKKKQMFR